MGKTCTDDCSTKGCSYFGLVGIIVDKVPSKKFVKEFKPEEVHHVINYCAEKFTGSKPESGVATTFWGIETNLIYKSIILDLEYGSAYKPYFKLEKGIYAPKGGIPNFKKKPSKKALENFLRGLAMRELLQQSQLYLDGERQGRYFMLTPYSKGCCAFQGGKIRIKLKNLEKLVLDYRKKK